MIELTANEVNIIYGAGLIQDALASVGGTIGNAGYNFLGSQLTIPLPVVGNVSLTQVAPNLGRSIGSSIGGNIGGTIESTLAGTPLIGGAINKLLGN